MRANQERGGIYVRGACPELLFALVILDRVFANHGYEMVVTSVVDGKHSSKSLHYTGRAADLRSRDIPADEQRDVLVACKDALPNDFDIVLESDHYHLEYDARGQLR